MQLGTRHDVLIECSANVVLSDSVFDRHPRYPYSDSIAQGIVFRDSTDCTITGLHVNGGTASAAIAVHGGKRFHLSNRTVLDVSGLALLLDYVVGSYVHGNMFDLGDPNRVAIRVQGGSGNALGANHVIGSIEQ